MKIFTKFDDSKEDNLLQFVGPKCGFVKLWDFGDEEFVEDIGDILQRKENTTSILLLVIKGVRFLK